MLIVISHLAAWVYPLSMCCKSTDLPPPRSLILHNPHLFTWMGQDSIIPTYLPGWARTLSFPPIYLDGPRLYHSHLFTWMGQDYAHQRALASDIRLQCSMNTTAVDKIKGYQVTNNSCRLYSISSRYKLV